jgi:hypothetical protein
MVASDPVRLQPHAADRPTSRRLRGSAGATRTCRAGSVGVSALMGWSLPMVASDPVRLQPHAADRPTSRRLGSEPAG